MIRINLLPHRAEKRRARQIQFISLGAISALAGVVLVAFIYGIINARIAYQEQRNRYLNTEISKLDKQIDELKKLREQTQALMARKEVVENLQSTRADVVHLLDQMLRILPDGVYLKSLKQAGRKIDIVGYAQSSARVSTLMRAIENSPWLELPTLIEVHSTTVSNTRLSEFSMSFSLSAPKPNAPVPVAGAPAPAAGGATPASGPVATSAPVAAAPGQKG
jgi:type IV pilus assembly protein PilN